MNNKLSVRTKHIESIYYILLFAAFLLGGVSYLRVRFDPFYQFSVLLVLSIFYFVWGMFYHHLREDLSIYVFWEYLAIFGICVLAAVMVFFG